MMFDYKVTAYHPESKQNLVMDGDESIIKSVARALYDSSEFSSVTVTHEVKEVVEF